MVRILTHSRSIKNLMKTDCGINIVSGVNVGKLLGGVSCLKCLKELSRVQ